MPTLNQLAMNRRIKRKKKNKRIGLEGCPQKRGTITRTTRTTPRKPNSALRAVMWVRLSNKKIVYAFIPGEVHTLQPHHHVYIRGGRVKDIPGMKYKGMRGILDFRQVLNRKTARTKYGVKYSIEVKKLYKRPFKRKILW